MEEDFFDQFEEGELREFFGKFKRAIYEELLSRSKAAADELKEHGELFLQEASNISIEEKIMFLDNALQLLEEVEEYERCSIVLKYKRILENSSQE